MEYYQQVQNRTGQTVAVINQVIPSLTVGTTSSAGLLSQSIALDGLAQTRDNALADFDQANNIEYQGFLAIRTLTLSLPQSAFGELDKGIVAEKALLDLLEPVRAIDPRTTELAMKRGKMLVSALAKINAYLSTLPPTRQPITSGGKGLPDIIAMLAAQPALEQAVEDRAADVTEARTALRTAAKALDKLNKRFYSKLKAEARTNATLAAALGQITTESANLPRTLSIRNVLQGGEDNLHVLLTYAGDTYDATAVSVVEWMLVGADPDFIRSVPVDPGGNEIGPFPPGAVVKLRSRVTNANGSTTGSIRTLTLTAPPSPPIP